MKLLACTPAPLRACFFKLPIYTTRLFRLAVGLVFLFPLTARCALESLSAFSVECLATPPGGAAELFESGCDLGKGPAEWHLSSLRLYGLPDLACHSLALSGGRRARWALGLRAFGPEEWQEQSLLIGRSAPLHASLSWRCGLGMHRLQSFTDWSGSLQSAHLGLEQRWQGGGLSSLYRLSRPSWAGMQGLRLSLWQEVAGWSLRLAFRSAPETPPDAELGLTFPSGSSRYEVAWLGKRGWRGLCSWKLGEFRVGALCWLHPVLPASLCFSFSSSLPFLD